MSEQRAAQWYVFVPGLTSFSFFFQTLCLNYTTTRFDSLFQTQQLNASSQIGQIKGALIGPHSKSCYNSNIHAIRNICFPSSTDSSKTTSTAFKHFFTAAALGTTKASSDLNASSKLHRGAAESGLLDLRHSGTIASRTAAKDLFKFRATDVLNFDLADVRLPGAIVDPISGQTRLAQAIPSNSISNRSARMPGVRSSASDNLESKRAKTYVAAERAREPVPEAYSSPDAGFASSGADFSAGAESNGIDLTFLLIVIELISAFRRAYLNDLVILSFEFTVQDILCELHS